MKIEQLIEILQEEARLHPQCDVKAREVDWDGQVFTVHGASHDGQTILIDLK